MNENNIKICRICLSTIEETNYEILESLRVEMLKIILVELNLSISINPIICHKCTDTLQKCFDFKINCLNTEDCIKTFRNIREPVKINLEDIYFKELSRDKAICKGQKICRLCFNLDSDYFANVNDDLVNRSLRDMLNKCVPELNLDLTNDSLVCKTCLDLLQNLFKFMLYCLKLEEKIKMYYDLKGIISHSVVDLSNIRLFIEDMKLENHSETNTNVENAIPPLPEAVFVKTEPNCWIFENEESEMRLDMKSKHENYSGNGEDNRSPQPENIPCPALEPSNLLSQFSLSTNFPLFQSLPQPEISLGVPNTALIDCIQSIMPRIFACKQCGQRTESNRDLKLHQLTHRTKKIKMYECDLCPFITRHNNVIENHKLTHKSSEEVNWHYCNICTYRTKLKANWHNHMRTHAKSDEVKRFKCDDCPYRTLWKRDLERHVVKHKSPEEIQMYSCDFCGFSTKHQRYLKYHIDKLHLKSIMPDDKTYNCAQCTFSTKSKRSLVPHMLIHRNPEDLKMFKCSFCSYEAKWKKSMEQHEEIHKKLFKCDECDFETRLKRFLTKHKLEHRSLDDLPIYSCDECSYKTTRKQGLLHHMLVHKNEDEVQMHQCLQCPYKTKRFQDLKHHITLIHTDNITIYTCEVCSYQTKYKNNFKNHNALLHKDPNEITMYKCDQCDFETKYKASLVSHEISYHKTKEEIKMEKCPKCTFETKRKECLRMHMVTHKGRDELEMFKCGMCGLFETKHKRALKKHIESHRPREERETTIYYCTRCEYKSKWKQLIRRHMKSHELDDKTNKQNQEWHAIQQQPLIIKNDDGAM